MNDMEQYKDMSREKLMEILISKHKECDEYMEENYEFRTLLCESKKEIEELREENKNLKIDLETSQDELKQTAADLFNDIEKLERENKALKEEVIAERKKVVESEEGWKFSVKMWGAEADFLKMDSAKAYPEEFNEYLKDAFDEETYKKMYDEFELAELLGGYECYCSECADALEKPDPTMTDKEFEEWFCDEETGGYDIMCEKCKEDYAEDSEDEE